MEDTDARGDSPSTPALNDGKDDAAEEAVHQKVLEGVKSGRFKSLSAVIRKLGLADDVRIIDVNFQTVGSADLYIMTLREPSGRVHSIEVDARTGDQAQ
ncbi:hypothetical protein [Rhizobium paknamense]|uniref:PepSY domain-containing protein n=1 Tax=Rhizobium paknamense TaxID=1206817 RepID=A0ABU0IE29_9HYPH|nr:hypothetical protein [Rhizobium paknamense]MDQ0455496.1 hypothetical protein [Rhizobium paknamense]